MNKLIEKKQKMIGVKVWIDSRCGQQQVAYCSFGKYIFETELDTFGVEDCYVMYYLENLEELQKHFLQKDSEEFNGTITKYELVYDKDLVNDGIVGWN